jgi:hypothetical protein
MNPTSTIAAGSTGILVVGSAVGLAGGGSNTPSTITDSVGNTWWKGDEKPGGSASSPGIAFYYCFGLTTQLTSSNNVPLTWVTTAQTNKAWAFMQADVGAGNVAFSVSANMNQQSTTGTPTVGGSGDSIPINAVAIGATCARSADTFTGDSDTLNGSWSTMQHVASGTLCSLMTQWKVVTAGGQQTFNPTLTSAAQTSVLARAVEVPSNVRSINPGTASGTSVTWSPRQTLLAGSLGVFCLSLDNAGTASAAAPTPVTDSAGNVWTQQMDAIYSPGAASAGAEIAIYTAPISSNFLSTSTITFTWAGGVTVVSKIGVFYEFVPTTGNSYAFVSGGFGNGTGAATTTPTVTTASIANGDVVIGMAGAKASADWTADSDTLNGNWSQLVQENASSGTASGRCVTGQYKTVNANGAQTYNPTQSAANKTMIGWAQIRQSPTTVTQSKTNGFFVW